MPKLLHEFIASELKRSGALWEATLITPGPGSSAIYPEEILARDGAAALGEGTKNWFKHPDEPGQQRDPRDQWGVIEEAWYESGVGLKARIRVLPHWREVVESLAENGQANLSIWASGDVDENGTLTALIPSVKNSVDLVDYPGRPGSALTQKLLESARAGASETPSVTSAQEKEGNMELEKKVDALATAVETLTAALTSFIAENKETADKVAAAEADAKANEDKVEQAVEAYATRSKAIDDAELLPSQAEAIRAEAKKGVDVTPLIESAKKVVDEAKAALSEKADEDEGGYTLHESGSDKTKSAATVAEGAF